VKVLTAKPPPAPPAFRWDMPRDQRVPPGAPAPGVPQPNPWDLFRLLIPEPELEAGTWQPAPSRTTRTPREPPEPTAEQISRLTNDQLRTLLKVAADSLSTGLDRLKTGDGWKNHLELAKLQQEFSDDTRQQLDSTVADGMKFGNLTIAEGIKRGDLTLAAGVKRGDLSIAAGMKFGDLTVADGTKLGDLTVADGLKRGNLTLEEGVKLGDLEAVLGGKPGDMTIVEAIKRGNLTVALGVKRGDLTIAEGIKRGNLTVALGFKDSALTDAGRLSGKLPNPTGARGFKDAALTDADDRDSRERLAKIADRFEKVAAEPGYEKIAAVAGFQTLRLGLREYTLPPAERQTHVLSARLPILTSALDRQRTGAAWKEFLKLEQLKRLLGSDDDRQSKDLDTLVEILGRFEKIRRDPQYAVVSRTRGFESTCEALRALVETLEEELVGSLPPSPE